MKSVVTASASFYILKSPCWNPLVKMQGAGDRLHGDDGHRGERKCRTTNRDTCARGDGGCIALRIKRPCGIERAKMSNLGSNASFVALLSSMLLSVSPPAEA